MSEISGKTNIHNIHFWNSELLSWYDDTKLKSSRDVSEFLKSLGKIHFFVIRWHEVKRDIPECSESTRVTAFVMRSYDVKIITD